MYSEKLLLCLLWPVVRPSAICVSLLSEFPTVMTPGHQLRVVISAWDICLVAQCYNYVVSMLSQCPSSLVLLLCVAICPPSPPVFTDLSVHHFISLSVPARSSTTARTTVWTLRNLYLLFVCKWLQSFFLKFRQSTNVFGIFGIRVVIVEVCLLKILK